MAIYKSVKSKAFEKKNQVISALTSLARQQDCHPVKPNMEHDNWEDNKTVIL